MTVAENPSPRSRYSVYSPAKPAPTITTSRSWSPIREDMSLLECDCGTERVAPSPMRSTEGVPAQVHVPASTSRKESGYDQRVWSRGLPEHRAPQKTRRREMAWDFSTEPEFQKKLDWVEEFCREEVEPLDYVFPYAVRSKDPKIRALVKGLQDRIKEQGLWAIFLD